MQRPSMLCLCWTAATAAADQHHKSSLLATLSNGVWGDYFVTTNLFPSVDPCAQLLYDGANRSAEAQHTQCAQDWAWAWYSGVDPTLACLQYQVNQSCVGTVTTFCQNATLPVPLRVCGAVYDHWSSQGTNVTIPAFQPGACEAGVRNRNGTFGPMCFEWIQHFGCGEDCDCFDLTMQADGTRFRAHNCLFHHWGSEAWPSFQTIIGLVGLAVAWIGTNTKPSPRRGGLVHGRGIAL